MEITTTLATTVTGGVLRTTQTMLGTATWTTTMGMQTETTTIRKTGSLLGVWGIYGGLSLGVYSEGFFY